MTSLASSVADKTDALEEKLNGIVQMLQRSQAAQLQTGSIPSISAPQGETWNNIFESNTFGNLILGSSQSGKAADKFGIENENEKSVAGSSNLLLIHSKSIYEIDPKFRRIIKITVRFIHFTLLHPHPSLINRIPQLEPQPTSLPLQFPALIPLKKKTPKGNPA